MAGKLITFLSATAVITSLNLAPAYAQSSHGGGHAMTPQASHPATPPVNTVKHDGDSGKHDGGATKPPMMTVAQRIDAHPQLVTQLSPLLPAGVTIDQAAAGFRNQGQFIAALHVSKDLNIPFDQLKTEMTGTDHLSLGKAIQKLDPTANAKAEIKTAEKETRADLKAAAVNPPKKTDNDKDGK